MVNSLVPASIVYQDTLVLSFMDTNSVTTGHVLIIPKLHHTFVSDVPRSSVGHLFTVAQDVAAAVRRSGIPCEGINLFVADGEAAFQKLFHFHVQNVAQLAGDTFCIQAAWSIHPAREELDRIAGLIRALMPEPGE
jgi:histidine triad (HIT) family protein